MRYREFKYIQENELIAEGGKSDAVRYLSELGVFMGMPGVLKSPIDEVDLNNVGDYINNNNVINLEKIQADIKKHVTPHIEAKPELLRQWYDWTTKTLLTKMFDRWTELKIEAPSKYGWIAGSNQGLGPVDVLFENHQYGGISVKDKGGITLKSPGMKDFGLEGDKGDRIALLAQEQYKQWMMDCMKTVIGLTKQKPDQPLFFGKNERDFLQFNSANNTFNLQGKGQKLSPLLENISEQDILKNAGLNLSQHRVFGDWYVKDGAKQKDPYMMPFKQAVMGQIEKIMETALKDQGKVKSLLQMGDKPYFYAQQKGIYEVPTAETVGELISTVQPLTAKKQETGINFIANFSKPENKDTKNFASVEVRFRWRNGLFASPSTIAIQNLKNAEALGWRKI